MYLLLIILILGSVSMAPDEQLVRFVSLPQGVVIRRQDAGIFRFWVLAVLHVTFPSGDDQGSVAHDGGTDRRPTPKRRV